MKSKIIKLQLLIEKRRLQFGSLLAVSIATGIPKRTLEDWKSGKRSPTQYIMSFLIHTFETLKPPKGD